MVSIDLATIKYFAVLTLITISGYGYALTHEAYDACSNWKA